MEMAIRPLSYRDEIDPTLKFFYKPHSITVLLIILGYLLYEALLNSSAQDVVANTKRQMHLIPEAYWSALWCSSSSACCSLVMGPSFDRIRQYGALFLLLPSLT
jgi:hypothetical protein